MSIGGPVDPAVDAAVAGSIAHGIGWVISAGNGNKDAYYASPARVPEAVTVGATTDADARAPFLERLPPGLTARLMGIDVRAGIAAAKPFRAY